MLYKYDKKTDSYRVWDCTTDGADVIVTYGKEGGKLVTKVTRATAKNIGKANETTPEQQAILEAASKAKLKMRKDGYCVSKERAKQGRDIALPMRCQLYTEEWAEEAKQDGGLYMQPKLNGVKITAQYDPDEERYRFFTKTGIPLYFSVYEEDAEELAKTCVDILKDIYSYDDMPYDAKVILDFELYKHGTPLQEIASVVSRGRSSAVMDDNDFQNEAENLSPVLVDFTVRGFEDEIYFHDRAEVMDHLSDGMYSYADYSGGNITIISTHYVTADAEIDDIYNAYVDQKFEGAIYRIADGLYEDDLRQSADVRKRKPWDDSEFYCIGGKEDADGGVVFLYRNDINDKLFEVRPKGKLEERTKYLFNLDEYIGKQHTIKFRERTPDGIPFHTSLEIKRDYE